MTLHGLKTRLPQLAESLDRRWQQWLDQGGRPDLADFLVDLADRGIVARTEIQDIISNLEVTLTLSEANNLPQGPRYHALGMLGKGAMGEVQLSRDRALGRNVAIKTLEPSLLGEPALAARFHQEAQITAQLDHPGIVPVYGIEAQPGHPPRYSMKLVRGKDLSKALREARAGLDRGEAEPPEFDLYTRLDIFVSIGDALAYAHDRGVIHRDLKPANIMLGAHHEVLVMDWGIAKLIGAPEAILPESAGDRSHQTQVGTILGTPTLPVS